MKQKTVATYHLWVQEFPGAVFVCDPAGTLLEMNEKARKGCQKEGGEKLIGTNVLDCHTEPARTKLKEMLEKQKANVYTIEKGGVKKLIYQGPWYLEGKFAGIVELSLEIPFEMPHFIREG
jgi:transcriptional regulator with PAS, ATPase and Fis domain